MPLLLMLPPKQRIKDLECGVGKSQALSLPACDICKNLRQKRESGAEGERKIDTHTHRDIGKEREREGAREQKKGESLHGM